MCTHTWECAVISGTSPETCTIFLNSQLTEKPLLRDFKNSEFQTEGVSINKLPIVRQVSMLNERKSGLPKLLVLVQWNSMFLSGKIQKLICKQNTPTYGKRWQASWNYSTKWANSKGLTRTLECLQSLSSMGEASSLLWVASGGSDGPFGHQRWSPQAAAVILSVWGHDTGLRGCKACCTIYPRLHSGQVWASLSYLQKGHTTYPQRSCEIDVKSNAFAFSGDTAQSHVIL